MKPQVKDIGHSERTMYVLPFTRSQGVPSANAGELSTQITSSPRLKLISTLLPFSVPLPRWPCLSSSHPRPLISYSAQVDGYRAHRDLQSSDAHRGSLSTSPVHPLGSEI